MNKLAKLIEEMDQEDLTALQKDLQRGTLHNALAKRKQELHNNKVAICPVCSSPIKQGEGYYLEFGKGIRKKATFDGLDCLLYFLNQMDKPK